MMKSLGGRLTTAKKSKKDAEEGKQVTKQDYVNKVIELLRDKHQNDYEQVTLELKEEIMRKKSGANKGFGK